MEIIPPPFQWFQGLNGQIHTANSQLISVCKTSKIIQWIYKNIIGPLAITKQNSLVFVLLRLSEGRVIPNMNFQFSFSWEISFKCFIYTCKFVFFAVCAPMHKRESQILAGFEQKSFKLMCKGKFQSNLNPNPRPNTQGPFASWNLSQIPLRLAYL